MKKIININLSGRVIPIEDSAYEKLQSYIESLRRYFATEEGRDEIINDIESRIAELMNEKVHKGAACVTDADIAEIIASMGRPEDFDADTMEATADTSKQNTKQDSSYTERKTRRRLYRDSSDKFIGGVCSGLANYLNTDPAIIRILFAIVAFGGFGLGFFAYLLFWIVLPDKDLEGFSGKRLYRNPDDRVLGGVAGGLAAYFDTRTTTIRLIFAAPIVLSILFGLLDGFNWNHDFELFPNLVFGSLTGTFILAYVILWMVLPEARSTYEKMEMRGEKVDVNSIRQNVKEGMGNVKDRVKEWSEEVKESAQNFGSKAKEFANTRGKTFAREVNETARNSGRGLGHAIGVLFKVFFLFVAGTIAFSLFVAVMALIFGGVAWWPINDFLWTSKWQQAFAWGTLIFFLLVPLVGFIIWIIRRILRVRSRRSYLGWTFGFLWTIGWVSAILLAASIYKDFWKYKSTEAIEIPVSQPANNKMIVVVSEPELEYTGGFSWIDNAYGWDLSGDTGRLSTIKFNYAKSIDTSYHVEVKKYSWGRSVEDALRRADRIQYNITSRDSVLNLGNGYTVDKESKFRGQQVEVIIYIPVGKKIHFDRTVPEKLNFSDFKFNRTHRSTTTINGRVVRKSWYDDDYFRFRTDVDYTMGNDGNLKDPSGKSVNDRDYYRYNDNQQWESNENNDSLNLQRQIQEEKQKINESERQRKESEQRIKDLEEKKNKKQSFNKKESLDDKDDAVASASSPVFSLVRTFF
jgi:phage shock protein PspC (stress-responsive transcriptional regulator)